jgi:hypothetical protein
MCSNYKKYIKTNNFTSKMSIFTMNGMEIPGSGWVRSRNPLDCVVLGCRNDHPNKPHICRACKKKNHHLTRDCPNSQAQLKSSGKVICRNCGEVNPTLHHKCLFLESGQHPINLASFRSQSRHNGNMHGSIQGNMMNVTPMMPMQHVMVRVIPGPIPGHAAYGPIPGHAAYGFFPGHAMMRRPF